MEPVTENEEEAPAAYAGGQVSTSVQLGVLGDRPTLDVPFNITGYTNKMMEDNQVATVDDVIVHDPSVSDQTLSGVSSAWNIRGFKAQQQDVQLNGLYGIAPRFYGGVEGVDRVDVLKGPSAILAGIAPNGSLGGTINYITKRAGSEPLNRVKILYGSDSVFTQQVDFGRRTDDGKAGLRINVLNRNGETSFDEHVRTDSITIGADYKGDRYRLGFDYGYVYNKVSDQQYQLTIGSGALKTMTSMFKVRAARSSAPTAATAQSTNSTACCTASTTLARTGRATSRTACATRRWSTSITTSRSRTASAMRR